MVNSTLVPDHVATLAATLVGLDLSLALLVHRDIEAEFSGQRGGSVRVRVPGAVPARTRGTHALTPIERDSVTEQAITVTLDTEAYSAVPLSDGDLDLDLVDFASQILRPQSQAIVKYVERTVAAAMQATPASAITYAAANPAKTFTAIRRQLRDNGVGSDAKLVAAVGSSIYADLLDAPNGTWDADGKSVRGIRIVESTRLAPKEIVALVPEAFALVVRAPAVPDGAAYGASIKDGPEKREFALRYIRSFDTNIAADVSIVTAFVGVQPMPLAVDKEDGTVDLVDNGGVIRVLAA